MIDKPIQMNDLSLSEKDIIQDKDNSILNKSFDNIDYNFPGLIDKKTFLQIKIEPLDYYLHLHPKSIRKILILISNNDKEELEDNYLDYITCLIGGVEELDRQQLLTPNKQMVQNALDLAYYDLLKQTKIYYINIPKININNRFDKKITLRNNSLEKISSFLNVSIFDMSEYIELFILSYKEQDSLAERFLLRAKLMGRLNNSLDEIEKNNEPFLGIRNYNLDIKCPKKCVKNKLQLLDSYFNNVWSAIEKENLNDENISFSETPFREEIREKNNNINLDLPNSNNIINNYGNNSKNKRQPDDLREENSCAERVCGNMCKIF